MAAILLAERAGDTGRILILGAGGGLVEDRLEQGRHDDSLAASRGRGQRDSLCIEPVRRHDKYIGVDIQLCQFVHIAHMVMEKNVVASASELAKSAKLVSRADDIKLTVWYICCDKGP